jgi:hypothetical protein
MASEHDFHIGEDHPRDGRDWEVQCARCGSSLDFDTCEMCGGEGVDGHDCGEDCCCCLDPEDNITCDACRGVGSFPTCASAASGWCKEHPREGRENIEPSTPEWFTEKSENPTVR